MQSDEPLDYAVFQLSPRRSRCELFVSYDGTMEKLASGLVKPFVTHLKVAEEQVAVGGKSIRLDLDVERYKNAETWFKKGTLERFVRFVSTPEVLEMVNTYDAEMSQLEAARKIYSQGSSDHESGTSGGVGIGATIASDATKKELLKAIDTRLSAVKQDLTTACSRASTAGFNPKTVSELQLFADHFGAQRLSEACSKFINLTQQRSDLFNYNTTTSKWVSSSDSVLRASTGSDMSLDDPSDDQPGPARCTTTKLTLPPRRFSREPSPAPTDELDETKNIKDKDFDKDKAMGSTTTESTSTSSGKPQLTRRLSVQERISLFENKAQNSPSTATTPTSTGGKPEFRRLPSDVNSSADKAVLRRWSGASDMSIDVSGERKEPDSNANTPTPSCASSSFPVFSLKSKDPTDPKSEEGIKDSKESVLPEPNSKSPSFAGRSLEKDQSSSGGVRSRAVEVGSPIQSTTEENLEGFSTERGQPRGEIADNSEKSTAKVEGKFVDIQGVANYDALRDQESSRLHFSGGQRGTIEGDLDSETSEVHVQLAPAQSKWQSLEEVGKDGVKDFESSQNQSESHSMQIENFGLLGGKSQGYGSAFDQVTRRGARKESALSGKSMIKSMDAFSSTSSVPIDQVPRLRQPKGNQGVNDELKMKANELEKLFAEHKLRAPAPGDQPNSARRIRPADMAKEVSEPVNRKQETGTMLEVKSGKGSNEMDKLSSTPSSKPCVNHDYDVTPKHNIYDLCFSDDSRGKLYQKYMQKRNAKLKEDWGSSRPEKEAQMKAMHDSLEKSRAEMKVKLAGSTERSNSAITRQRAEKMRSLNLQSAMKRAQTTDPSMSDEDEVQAEFLGKKLTETYLGDSSSKSAPGKRVQPNKNTSSPTTRNPAGTAPRSSGKASNSTTGRRRLPYDNPLTQSVPNFSDLRKENTRPSPGGSKVVRPQGRNHARKKSIIEDSSLINEDKPRRLQLKKTTVTTRELNDSRNSDDVDDAQFMASKYLREENEDYEKISNDLESTTLPGKGNGIEQIPSSGMGISKALVTEEAVRNGHSFDDTSCGTEEMMIAANDEEHDHETTLVRKSIYVDNSKERLSVESDNNALQFVSQAGSVLAAESPAPMHSLFQSMGSTLDSPGESPGSWNLRLQNPYAFSHDISDIDALESPTESPASWNFRTLSQSEAETARMRKKWGAAQKPIGGIDSSHSPSRKDVTKSLKRFLKFGRRNRASENLADWISATTSEGDDSEDGRDIANRSSEDLGKSRMGFSQSHNSDEGFNGPDLFNEQVQALRSSIPTPPSNFKLREEHLSGSSMKASKSFFSLSNFRSKANDSKLR
ncbi:uncharacterized protein LOC141633532 [Silene latifolia]|uniref:uncharacterized protein LOC141633532 n=1 Tax=Silene latifolia TaxID=37657 RepID=UPI003D77B352